MAKKNNKQNQDSLPSYKEPDFVRNVGIKEENVRFLRFHLNKWSPRAFPILSALYWYIVP